MDEIRFIHHRGYKRFSINKILVAEIRLYPIIRGQITDISLRGLSFNYLQSSSIRLEGILEYFELAILLGDNTVLMEGVPCKTILDVEIPKDFMCMIMQNKRFCVKFDRLSSDQKTQLQSIIKKYCT